MASTMPPVDTFSGLNRTTAVSASSATFTSVTPGSFFSPFSTAVEHAEHTMPDTESCGARECGWEMARQRDTKKHGKKQS